jgi:hypothetical protein
MFLSDGYRQKGGTWILHSLVLADFHQAIYRLNEDLHYRIAQCL